MYPSENKTHAHRKTFCSWVLCDDPKVNKVDTVDFVSSMVDYQLGIVEQNQSRHGNSKCFPDMEGTTVCQNR